MNFGNNLFGTGQGIGTGQNQPSVTQNQPSTGQQFGSFQPTSTLGQPLGGNQTNLGGLGQPTGGVGSINTGFGQTTGLQSGSTNTTGFGQNMGLQTGNTTQTGLGFGGGIQAGGQTGFGQPTGTGFGGLGGQQTSTTSTGTGFGGQQTGTGFNIGGQQTGGTILGGQGFGSSTIGQPQPQQTSSIFGQQGIKPTTTSTSMFQPSNPTVNIQQTGGFENSLINYGVNIKNQQQVSSQKRDQDHNEIINVIQSFLDSTNPEHHSNLFKYMLYNKIPKDYEQYIQTLQCYKERVVGDDNKQIAVDQSLWFKAINQNPNRSQFFPCQISSPEALIHRIKTSKVFQLSAIETVMSLEKKLNDINNKYDTDIESKSNSCKAKHQTIKTMHLNIISKMDKLAFLINKTDKNYNLEMLLANKLSAQKNFIKDCQEYVPKIKEISSLASQIGIGNSYSDSGKDFFKDFDGVRLEKNVNILSEMKNIFEVTLTNLKQNSGVINFIHNDLENLKKHGKIAK